MICFPVFSPLALRASVSRAISPALCRMCEVPSAAIRVSQSLFFDSHRKFYCVRFPVFAVFGCYHHDFFGGGYWRPGNFCAASGYSGPAYYPNSCFLYSVGCSHDWLGCGRAGRPAGCGAVVYWGCSAMLVRRFWRGLVLKLAAECLPLIRLWSMMRVILSR